MTTTQRVLAGLAAGAILGLRAGMVGTERGRDCRRHRAAHRQAVAVRAADDGGAAGVRAGGAGREQRA